LLGVDTVGLAKVRVRRVFPADAAAVRAETVPKPPKILPETDPDVTIIDLPASNSAPAAPGFMVQVAALSDPGRISWLKGFLAAYGPVVTQPGPAGLTRIRLGPYASQAAADTALAQLRAAGYADARLVKP
jgi:rare lipoprotein A